MSIRIEVTGASIPEVADKLLAIGRSLHNTAIDDADDAAREASQAKRSKPKAARTIRIEPELPEPQEEVGNAPPTEAPKSAPVAEDTESLPTTAEPSSTPAQKTVVPDFESEVTHVVLAGVKTRGKAWVQDILAQFGVERASQVPDEQLAELVAVIKDGLE